MIIRIIVKIWYSEYLSRHLSYLDTQGVTKINKIIVLNIYSGLLYV